MRISARRATRARDLLTALTLPPLTIGAGLLTGYFADSFWGALLTLTLSCGAGLIWMELLVESPSQVLTWVAGAAMVLAYGAAAAGIGKWVLADRGLVTDCAIVSVTEREVQSDDSSTTVHDHRLACAGAGPDLLTSARVVANTGERIPVAYDPAGTISPRPAADLEHGEVYFWVVLIAGGLTVLTRVADALFVED